MPDRGVYSYGPGRRKRSRARAAYLEADYARASVLADEAHAMAESLGLDSLRAEALLYLGASKVELGDATGIDDVRESVAVFTAINSPEAARAYNNLSVLVRFEGEVNRAHELSYEGVAIAKRFGLAPFIRWDAAGEPWRHHRARRAPPNRGRHRPGPDLRAAHDRAASRRPRR